MSIKQKIEEREHQRAKDQHMIKLHIKTMEQCIAEAKEQHLPTCPFMEANLKVLKYLVKARTGLTL